MITQPWIQQLGWTLLHFLWQGLLLASLLAVLLVCLQKQSASVRYLVRCAALVLMGLCPLLTWGFLDPSPAQVPVHEAHSHGGGAAADGAAAMPTSLGDLPLADQLLTWFVGAWALGALWFLVRLLVGLREVRRMMQRCESPMPLAWQRRFQGLCAAFQVKVAAHLTRSAQVAVPVVVGWFRPVVLLPARLVSGMTEEQVAALLAHELAHVRRHDALVNLGQTLIESLFFYHPAVWWVSHGIRVEREFCCDDMAVAAMGRALPYARALATLETFRGAELRLAPSSRGGPLMLRVQRLVGDRGATDRGFLLRSLPGAVGLLLMGVLGATAWASSTDPMDGDDKKKGQRRVILTLQTGKDGKPLVVKSVTLDENAPEACPECGHKAVQARPQPVIRGRVVDPKGQPVEGAQVRWIENRPTVIHRNGKDLGVATVDLNRDGLLDVWVTNRPGEAVQQVDVDEDGDLDLWVTSTDAEGRFEWTAVDKWNSEGAAGGGDGQEPRRQRVRVVDPAVDTVQWADVEVVVDDSRRALRWELPRATPKDGGPAEGNAVFQWLERGDVDFEWVEDSFESPDHEILDELRADVVELEYVLEDSVRVDHGEQDILFESEADFTECEDLTFVLENSFVDTLLTDETVVDRLLADETVVDLLAGDEAEATEGTWDLLLSENVVPDDLAQELPPLAENVWVQTTVRPAEVQRENTFIERVHVIADENGWLTNNFVHEKLPADRTEEVHVRNIVFGGQPEGEQDHFRQGRVLPTPVKERLVDDAAQTFKIELRGEVTLTPTGVQANELRVTDFSRVVDQPVRVIENRVQRVPSLRQGEYRVRLETRPVKGPDGSVILEVLPVMETDLSLPKAQKQKGTQDKNTKDKARYKKVDTIKVRRISM